MFYFWLPELKNVRNQHHLDGEFYLDVAQNDWNSPQKKVRIPEDPENPPTSIQNPPTSAHCQLISSEKSPTGVQVSWPILRHIATVFHVEGPCLPSTAKHEPTKPTKPSLISLTHQTKITRMLHFHISEEISQLKNSKEFTYFHHRNHPVFIDFPYISIDSIHFSQPFLPGVAPPVVAHPDVPPGLPIRRSPESSVSSVSCCRPRSISGRWGEASAVRRMVTIDDCRWL